MISRLTQVIIFFSLIILGIIIFAIYGFSGLNIFLQILIALALVFLLQIISVLIYDKQYLNELTNYNTPRKETLIIDGIYDLGINKDTTLNTNDELVKTYISLEPSINQSGGAEYSYNFWLYKDFTATVPAFTSDYKVLFLRGSRQQEYINTTNTGNCLIKNRLDDKPSVLVKNPLVRINKAGTKIIIEYNTITNPDGLNSDGSLECSSDTNLKDNNMLGIYDFKEIYNSKFSMITIVFKETSSNNDILNKNNTNCKLYLNGSLVLDRNTYSPYRYGSTTDSLSTAMKNNKNPFYINPTNIYTSDEIAHDSKLAIADLKYYNYALDQKEISKLFNDKFKTSTYKPPDTTMGMNEISDKLTINSKDPKPI
jgi:hypothetical protein